MNAERFKLWRALNWPNRLSLLRLLLVPPFLILLTEMQTWQPARHVALGLFFFLAVSDAVDGQLARRLHCQTRLGAILDPIGDKALVIGSLILLARDSALGAPFRLPDWLVVLVIGKDVWVIVGFLVVYLVTDRFRVHPTVAGKACTIAQLLLVAIVLVSPDLGPRYGHWAVTGMSFVAAGAAVWAVLSYTRLGLKFTLAEQKPLD